MEKKLFLRQLVYLRSFYTCEVETPALMETAHLCSPIDVEICMDIKDFAFARFVFQILVGLGKRIQESDDQGHSMKFADTFQGKASVTHSKDHITCLRLDMQASRRQKVEVVIDGHEKATNGSTAGRLRPLSVDEALQYSPLTTSVTSGYGTSFGRSFHSLTDYPSRTHTRA